MTLITSKLTAASLAAVVIATVSMMSTTVNAKPGHGGGGGFKASSFSGGGFKSGGYKPIGFKSPSIVKGPMSKPFPGKIVKLPPICKFGKCGPGPKPAHGHGHGHGHGNFWLLGGVTILASQYNGCGYEYYKWKSTDSAYWYARYQECRAS
jgi:hypothetical protein